MFLFVLAVTTALVVSFVCSIFEAVLLSIGILDVNALKDSGSRAGKILDRFQKEPDIPIAAILILNTLAHTVGASVAGATYGSVYDESTLWVFSLVFTLAVLLFTEIVPKTLGVAFNRKLAGPVAIAVQGLVILLKPVLVLTRKLTQLLQPKEAAPVTSYDEIRLLATIGRDEGVVGHKTASIIEGAGRLRDLTAADVMMPRQRIQYLSAERSFEENLEVLRGSGHSRFPYTSSRELDNVTGIVLAKDVLFGALDSETVDWDKVIRPTFFVPETAPLHHVLRMIQQERRHLAVVVDEYGGTSGIVTLEDILEEIVGEIWDETDRREVGFVARGSGGWVCGGSAEIRGLFHELGIEPSADDGPAAVTVSGFMMNRLGSIPAAGQFTEYAGHRFTVTKASDRGADRVEIDKLPGEDPNA